jgi:hypothetical protein
MNGKVLALSDKGRFEQKRWNTSVLTNKVKSREFALFNLPFSILNVLPTLWCRTQELSGGFSRKGLHPGRHLPSCQGITPWGSPQFCSPFLAVRLILSLSISIMI